MRESRLYLILTACVLAVSASGCKKDSAAPAAPKEEVKAVAPAAAPAILKDLVISRIPDAAGARHSDAEVALRSKPTDDFILLSIDDTRNRIYIGTEYEKSTEKISGYPAQIKKEADTVRVSVLIKKAIELSVTAQAKAPAQYKDAEVLKQLIPLFDLPGLEKQDLAKAELDGKADLEKYLPKLK
jgi:hypothetical protein